MNQAKLLLAATFVSLAPATAALAETKQQPITPYADIRYRLEVVDQTGLPNDATASTLRVRSGVKTAEGHGFSPLVEGEDDEVAHRDAIGGVRPHRDARADLDHQKRKYRCAMGSTFAGSHTSNSPSARTS